MKKILQRGFTLIELLVVIAIIGILAAVVLASLNDARSSGSDAAIKQSLGNLRSQAEIHYNQNSFDYAGVCADGQVIALATSIQAANAGGTYTCASVTDAWGAESALVSTTSVWCVDSTGFSGELAASTIDATSGSEDTTCD